MHGILWESRLRGLVGEMGVEEQNQRSDLRPQVLYGNHSRAGAAMSTAWRPMFDRANITHVAANVKSCKSDFVV